MMNNLKEPAVEKGWVVVRWDGKRRPFLVRTMFGLDSFYLERKARLRFGWWIVEKEIHIVAATRMANGFIRVDDPSFRMLNSRV